VARLKTDPISAADLSDFVDTGSDFGFEMKTLAQLRAEGFECSHAGSYRDPVTQKIRQFDIRALVHRAASTLALAVECKNISANNPLLLSAVPRIPSEAFHDLIVYRSMASPPFVTRTVGADDSVYRPGAMVGKQTDQVGRDASRLYSNDVDTFEKLNQAVNSCQDLIGMMLDPNRAAGFRVAVPVLVVPAGRLWQVDYNSAGEVTVPPRQVERSSYFLDHTWVVPTKFEDLIRYRLSHVEVITLSALPGIVETWSGASGFFCIKA
jgi:hypothetical protein